MSTPNAPKRMMIRWTTLRGLAALFLFTIIAALVECLVVFYAINLGVEDRTLLQWGFKFPGTDWSVTLAVSPLFHLVPITVIVTLVSVWIYLAKHVVIRPREIQGRFSIAGKREKKRKLFGKIGSTLSRINVFAYVGRKVRLARATVRSALIVFVVFLLFILVISLLVYPQMVYETISSAYQTNPALLNFVRGTGEALASVGSVFSGINDALIAASPGLRDFVQGLGGVTAPLAEADNTAKYLVFQNAAAWIAALVALLYGEFRRKSYPYKKK
jgi:hypothetical protein